MIEGLVAKRGELVSIRKEAEDAIKTLKAEEVLIEGQIMEYLDRQGTTGVKLPSGWSISKSQRASVRFGDDPELVCQTMLAEMIEARDNGTPLVNALLLNRAAASTKLLDRAREELKAKGLPETAQNLNNILRPLGFYADVKDVLHFTAARVAA
jgi:hypothetical protein